MNEAPLFDAIPGQAPAAALLEGLLYLPDFLDAAEEAALLARLPGLDFAPFMLRGFPSKRRVASFGMALDFRGGTSWPSRSAPDYLTPLIERVAARLGLDAAALVHCLVTEYPPGAIINWHRDAAQFELICGISLGSPCTLRLRPCATPQAADSYGSRARPDGLRRPGRSISVSLEPRSLYILRGPARRDWEHSIAPLTATRYSITLRTLYAAS